MATLKSNPRQSMLVISLGFSLIYLLGLLKSQNFIWALFITLLCSSLGLISLTLSKKVEWLWFKIAWLLSFIVPNILLSFIYFLILVPLALLNRLFSKNEILQLKNPKGGLWKSRAGEFSPDSMEKPW